ncbi:MAG: hypothetical protein Q9181_002683 [Wetmoreana brouardii]
MAAGKRSRVKLKIDIRAKLKVDSIKEVIKYPSMASEPKQKPPSPMEAAPLPTSPLEHIDLASIPPQQPMSRASASLAAARRRRMSKDSMSSTLKRSASTPNVRGLVASESGMSLADKRRNKLGYHRTLKKECCFFPVDQQPQMDRRPRTGSKAGSGELSASSSSSPALAGGPVLDHYHPDRSRWESPFYDHGPTSAGHSTPEDPSHHYWRLGDSPMTPAFSHFSGPSNSLTHHAYEPRTSFAAFTSPREEHCWPVAPRSMSFGQVEDLSHSYPNPYRSPMSIDYRRRPSEMYPPSLQTSSGNSSKHNSNGEVSTPPLVVAVTTQPMAQFVAPAWNALPGQSVMSKAPEYSTWYSEPAPLAKVQEEEVGPSYDGGPGAVFTSVG